MKVALVYDRIVKWGGAERVLLALHEIFPEAPLYTAVYREDKARWARVFDIHTSFAQYIPGVSVRHEAFAWLMPFVFESFSFDDYDAVVSVTSSEAKGIITKPKTLHVCYCLTPTRYLWSHYDEYFSNPAFKMLTTPIVSHMKRWDKTSAQRPDHMIAISNAVATRIKKYYDRKCEVVYPPAPAVHKIQVPAHTRFTHKDFFLVVSRLVKYKKVDLVIDACNALGKTLIIIGTGTQEAKLKRMAGTSIHFISNLTERELAWYYTHAQAFIMPQEEDFGLSAAEAQSYGTPVIAYRAGGALDIVIEGKSGVFFDAQYRQSLISVILSYERNKFRTEDCMLSARRFRKSVFQNAIWRYVTGR